MKPVGQHIIVTLERDTEFKLEGGLTLALPATADQVERPNKGIIVAVGDNPPAGEGAHILFNRFAGARFDLDRKEYVVLSNDDVLVIL